MGLLGSAALRKYLFGEFGDDPTTNGGYFYSSAFDHVGLQGAVVQRPHEVRPWTSMKLPALLMAMCAVTTAARHSRTQEKWFVISMLLSMIFYVSMKCHKVDNGYFGHQAGFWGAAIASSFSLLRGMVGAGSARFNCMSAAFFAVIAWREIGRFHLWGAHLITLRKSDGRAIPVTSIWSPYIPEDVDPDLLLFRGVESAAV